ncbi:MAG: hypothetical protein F4139_03130 [Gemmatimonadetes bacterium]|nr:hypothetical protein [Gemmatimonadota bacterium]MYA65580.1 hypothetical protein [Gemmatimonadota bacterium]MYB98045.1 hypothetical protein [Gemmatimonadota bacterium]MYH51927.1 hypothetical protein [Gemmatimonadota bacterium]MYI44873.1 hypothetical protein [Gemmatimonadota bacterium]
MAEIPLFHSAGHADQRVSVIGSLSGAMFLGIDQVVFVDRLSQQLVFLNTDSGAVASAGRRGDGPQEFKSVRLLARAADGSVAVWDPIRHRMNLVGIVNGKGVIGEVPGVDKSALRSRGIGMTEPIARYEDGTVVYEGRELPSTPMFSPNTREPGHYRNTFSYWLAVPGEPLRLLFEGLGSELFNSAAGSGSATQDVIFGHSLLHTQVGEFVAVSQTDLGSVLVFDRSGGVMAEVPLEPGTAVTQEDIDAVRERRLATNADQTRQIREQMQGQDFPVDIASLWAKRRDNIRTTPANETAPPIDRMQGDLDGRLWLRLFRPGETGQRWQVWELGGPRLVFTLVLPEGEAFLDATGDRVLLRARDEFDVDYLVIKGIAR